MILLPMPGVLRPGRIIRRHAFTLGIAAPPEDSDSTPACSGDVTLIFLVCFSQASLSRAMSYQNEELVLAIEQLRLKPADDS